MIIRTKKKLDRYELEECLEIALNSLRCGDTDKCHAHVEKANNMMDYQYTDLNALEPSFPCPRCKGYGTTTSAFETKAVACKTCQGSGRVEESRFS